MYILSPKKSAFTLIEVMISITIFGIIMLAVMTIFMIASQMSTRVELQRNMQENVKNTLDILAEDIRKNGILGGENIQGECSDFSDLTDSAIKTQKLCLSSGSEYALGKRVDDAYIKDYSCDGIEDQCYIIKKNASGEEWYPLTNSLSHIRDLRFHIQNKDHPLVQISIVIRPAIRNGLGPQLLEAQETLIQTSISTRFIQQQ